jgi:DNA-directed RNA polymerase specialized sigma24 family protein
MNLIERFQDELYSLALTLTYDHEKSKRLALDTFEKTLSEASGNFHKIKIELYKSMLQEIGALSIKRNKCKNPDILSLVKKHLSLFDKKAFVLKYEFGISVEDICYILDAKVLKVKKSLLSSIRKVAKKLEDDKNEM